MVVHQITFHGLEPLSKQESASHKDLFINSFASVSYISTLFEAGNQKKTTTPKHPGMCHPSSLPYTSSNSLKTQGTPKHDDHDSNARRSARWTARKSGVLALDLVFFAQPHPGINEDDESQTARIFFRKKTAKMM